MILEVDESDYTGPIPDETVLLAEVTNVRQIKKPFQDDEGNDILRMEFSFVIADPDSEYNGQRVWGDTPLTFSENPKCKLRNWLQTIMGVELPAHTKVDTDEAKSKQVRVIVKQKVTNEGKENEDIRNYVSELLPVKGSRVITLDESEPF